MTGVSALLMTGGPALAYLAAASMAEEQKPDDGPGPHGSDGGAGGSGGAPLAHTSPKRTPARWGDPLMRIDVAWTRFETWLAVGVLLLEILALSLWVMLKGLSTPAESESAAGLVFRALIGAIVLGLIGYFALKKKGERAQRWGGIAGTVIGLYLGKFWLGFGVDYTSNLLNWYQQASTLTLFGGLRGIGTRLTLLLALLGGSLATASGKHITIDFITRFLSDRARLPVVVIGWLGASLICFGASWGFFDHIAIENFGAKAQGTPREKIAKVTERLEEQFFILRKQIGLDLRSTWHVVLKGEIYSDWLSGSDWNRWLDESGFRDRYGEDELAPLRIPDGDTRSPIVVIPGRGEPRGELIDSANLVFPFGLLVIALRFVMRSLLALSGHVSVDPDESGEFTTDKADAAAAKSG